MSKAKQQLLIVDDSKQILELLLRCLCPLYDCTIAKSAREAIEKLRVAAYDLVITDITMPGVSGLELCELIRHNYPNTVVIVMSANGRELHELYDAEVRRRGAFAFLAKPFEKSGLLDIVLSALASQSSRNSGKDPS